MHRDAVRFRAPPTDPDCVSLLDAELYVAKTPNGKVCDVGIDSCNYNKTNRLIPELLVLKDLVFRSVIFIFRATGSHC